MLKTSKRIIALLLCLSFALMLQIPTMAQADNLIPSNNNPDFENGAFKNDAVYGRLQFKSGVETEIVEESDGNSYLKVTTTADEYAADTWDNITIREFDFDAGSTYVFAFDVKLPEADSNASYKGKWTKNGDNDHNYLTDELKFSRPTLSTKWQTVVSVFTCKQDTNKNGNKNVNMCIRLYSISKVSNTTVVPKELWIDNIKIYKVGDASNLLNSTYSFEAGVPSTDVIEGSPALYKDGSEGDYSMKLTGTASNGVISKVCRFININGITGGDIYEISADVKLLSDEENVKAFLTTTYSGASQSTGEALNDVAANYTAINNGTWTKVKRYYATNAATTAKMHIGLGLSGVKGETCDVLVDNFVVKKVADATEAVGVGTTTAKYAHFDKKLSLSISDTDKSIWVLFAKYNGTELDDVTLNSYTLNGNTITLDFASEAEKNNCIVYAWEKDTFSPLINKIDLRTDN